MRKMTEFEEMMLAKQEELIRLFSGRECMTITESEAHVCGGCYRKIPPHSWHACWPQALVPRLKTGYTWTKEPLHNTARDI